MGRTRWKGYHKKMKKNTIYAKKCLLFPKIMATIASVGGTKNRLQNHKTKEIRMVTESVKSYRYEKIESAIVESVHELADKYKEKIGCCDEEKDQEAYTNACNMLMEDIAKAFGNREMYWIYEVILQESFDYEPSQRNPYAIRKPKEKIEESHIIDPYKLMVQQFQ